MTADGRAESTRAPGGKGIRRLEPLRLAYSPCPNDTFLFHAWVHGLLPEAPAAEVHLADIDALNRLAHRGEADVVKVSMYAFARLRHEYALLHSGGAIGRGCGPLVVAPKDSRFSAAPSVCRVSILADELARARVAVPGELTTAAMLADLFTGGLERPVCMAFDRIMPAVRAGEVEAGVIIHEGRFTFGSYGLRRLIDLGEWWEELTELPLPLGGIAVRRSLGQDLMAEVERAVHASVIYGREHPDDSADYVRANAQEMDESVCRQHIDLYVNEYTEDYGPEGEAAIARLLKETGGLPWKGDAERELAAGVGIFWDAARRDPMGRPDT